VIHGGDCVNQGLPRKIRSFVRREGRMTRAQREALERLAHSYIIPEDTLNDLDVVFKRCAPRVLEIGFGMGDLLAYMAKVETQKDYLGIEVHRPGIGSLLLKLEKNAIDNVRIICGDAADVLKSHILDESFDCVNLFFPDPWPKKRHHKRRMVQAEFVDLIRYKLKPGGIFHITTDWEDYARHILQVMEAAPHYRNVAGIGEFSPRSLDRPMTKFERRGQHLGHEVWELVFMRN
jgi:tRNA (guanine-N7-)-methyltransferase